VYSLNIQNKIIFHYYHFVANKPLLQELGGERGQVSCLCNVRSEVTKFLVFWLEGTTAVAEGHGKVNTYVTFHARMTVV